MATLIEIPVQVDARISHYAISVQLDSLRWFFNFYTVKTDSSPTTDGRWYFNLGSEPENPTIAGVCLSTGLDLLAQYRHLEVPSGALWVADVEGSGQDPDILGFIEKRFKLLYLQADS